MTPPMPRARSLDELRRMVEARKAEKTSATANLLVTACLIVEYAQVGADVHPSMWRDYEQRMATYTAASDALMAAYDAVEAVAG